MSETLRRLQEDFQGYLLTPDARMHPHVLGSAQVSAEERLAIYANAYRLRLLEALGTDYPGLHTVLGDDDFDAMGRAYIAAHPSPYFSLRWFGDRMERVSAHAPRLTRNTRCSPKWRRSNGPRAMPLMPPTAPSPTLATWPPSRPMPGQASGSCRTPRCGASICAGTCRPSGKRSTAGRDAGSDQNRRLESDYPVAWLVWRQDLLTYFRSLNVDEAWALDAMQRGETFADICEGLTEWIDAQNVAVHAVGLLKQWLTDGLISEIRIT